MNVRLPFADIEFVPGGFRRVSLDTHRKSAAHRIHAHYYGRGLFDYPLWFVVVFQCVVVYLHPFNVTKP